MAFFLFSFLQVRSGGLFFVSIIFKDQEKEGSSKIKTLVVPDWESLLQIIRQDEVSQNVQLQRVRVEGAVAGNARHDRLLHARRADRRQPHQQHGPRG